MNTRSAEGEVALVTGANRGIGKAIVQTLIEAGARKVYAAVRDPDTARPLVEEHGDRVVPLELDLTREDTIQKAAAEAADAKIVINNAGVLKTASALDESAHEALDFEMQVNVHGLLRMARAFAPVLEKQGGGVFVQLNSVVSMKNFPDFTTYCASKAAAYSITQALRVLLAEQGTHVISVHPGPIDTDMGQEAGLSDIAEPADMVGKAILEALREGDFHAFPDSMARELGEAYASFARNVIEAEPE